MQIQRTTLNISKPLYKSIKKLSIERESSMQNLINEALFAYLYQQKTIVSPPIEDPLLSLKGTFTTTKPYDKETAREQFMKDVAHGKV